MRHQYSDGQLILRPGPCPERKRPGQNQGCRPPRCPEGSGQDQGCRPPRCPEGPGESQGCRPGGSAAARRLRSVTGPLW